MRIRFPNKYVGVVIDRFGKDVPLRPDGNENFIARSMWRSVKRLRLDHRTCREVKILSPDWVAGEYKSLLNDLGRMYSEGDDAHRRGECR